MVYIAVGRGMSSEFFFFVGRKIRWNEDKKEGGWKRKTSE